MGVVLLPLSSVDSVCSVLLLLGVGVALEVVGVVFSVGLGVASLVVEMGVACEDIAIAVSPMIIERRAYILSVSNLTFQKPLK